MVKSSGNNTNSGVKSTHQNNKGGNGSGSNGGDSGKGFNSNAITPQYIPTYNAPSYNDPNNPMSKLPTAVDNSVINDNIYGSSLPKGELKKLQGNIIPKRNNKLLQGTNNRTIISGDYYATGEVHTLKPDLPQFDAPSTFQMGLPQNGQPANYAGQPVAFNPNQVNQATQANPNIPPLPQINPAQPAPGQMPATYPANYQPQAYAQYQQYQPYAQYPSQGYAYPPQGMPGQPTTPTPVSAVPTTFVEGKSPEATHAQPKPAPAPVYGSIEYLNYIEPEALKNQHRPIDNKLFVFAGIGVTIVVVIVSVMAALSAQNDGPLAGLTRIQRNIANVQSIVAYAQKNISIFTRVENRAINEILLTIDTQEIELANATGMGQNAKGKYKGLKPDSEIKDKLDDARAQGRLDRDLPNILSQNLDKLINSIKSIKKSVRKKKQSKALDSAINDLTTVANRFDFNVKASQALDRANSAADAATIDRKKSAAKGDKTSSDKPKTVTGDPDSAGK